MCSDRASLEPRRPPRAFRDDSDSFEDYFCEPTSCCEPDRASGASRCISMPAGSGSPFGEYGR